MKGLVCVLALTLNYFSFPQSYPHLFELRGLEDSLGNSHLFYRYGHPKISHCWSKSIYHINMPSGSDKLFIYDDGSDPIGEGCRGQYVYDYEFFNNDPAKYMYGGYDYFYDPVALLVRYDTYIQFDSFGGITEIEISAQNDSLVYAALESSLYKSTDGGYNFEFLDSIQFIDNSMISLSKNNDSHIYGVNDNNLVRSEGEGYNYIIVDDSQWDDNSELFYDPDGNHIYGESNYYNFPTQSYLSNIYVSNDNGNPFTWTSVITQNLPISFTHDEIQSGEVYYSYQRNIYKSTDYGNTFNHYKQLDRNITGLYKKSGTDILYASTPLNIYEIIPDTVKIIKSLPIPDEVLNYYPLAVGNRWVYDKYTHIEWDTYHDIFIRTVVGDSLLPNGKKYFHLFEDIVGFYSQSYFERVDSSDGKVYRYDDSQGFTDDEYVIDDLLAEPGDTILSYRMGYSEQAFTTMLDKTTFNKWGLTKPKKVFEQYILHPPIYSLTQDIGLDSIFSYFDFGETSSILKGCIINGVVYGDTTVVSVDDEEPNKPYSFKLEQNYPNPFNPTTKIKYSIPAVTLRQAQSDIRVSMIIYDVLGKEIVTLVNEQKPAGTYEVNFDATGLPSGIYFYRLSAGSYSATKKMILLK